jgi:hypothetical protein
VLVQATFTTTIRLNHPIIRIVWDGELCRAQNGWNQVKNIRNMKSN